MTGRIDRYSLSGVILIAIDTSKLMNFIALACSAVLIYTLFCTWLGENFSGLALLQDEGLSAYLALYGVSTWQTYLPMGVCVVGIITFVLGAVRMLRPTDFVSQLFVLITLALGAVSTILAVLFIKWNINGYDIGLYVSGGAWIAATFGLLLTVVGLFELFAPLINERHPPVVETELVAHPTAKKPSEAVITPADQRAAKERQHNRDSDLPRKYQ